MVSPVILLVNVVHVVAQEGVAAVALGTVGVQAMEEGVTVLVEDPQDVAVLLLVDAVIAGHQDIVDERSCHMPTEMA